MSDIITFYDIPSVLPDRAWSPNTWRVMCSLNYKGLAFTTVWVEYPDIEKVCKKLGVAPAFKSTNDSTLYPLPVIHDPSTGTALSDGPTIIEYLDVTYPSTPSLLPMGTRALQYAFLDAHLTTLRSIWAFTISAVPQILNSPSQKYYRATREQWYGKKVEELTPTGPQREEGWKK